VALALLVAATVLLRVPGIQWPSTESAPPNLSFQVDEQRFVVGAQDIKVSAPDGYPQGMTTHLYVLHALLGRVSGLALLPMLHAISIFYAGLSVLLAYLIARSWRMSQGCALLGAAFLSVSPLFVMHSNVGTADVTAMFYFYATLLAGGEYLRTQRQLWFVVLCALTGFTVGVKFFVPLFVPLALVLALERKGKRLAQLASAACIVFAAFEAFSLFRYTPWDLHHLFVMLRDDNVVIGAAESDIIATGPLSQLRRYGWDLVSAVGIPTALLFAAGVVRLPRILRGWAQVLGSPSRRSADWRRLATPESLFVAALSVQALLLLLARVHFQRHVLVFVPLICIAAARTLFWLFERWTLSTPVRTLALVLILAFQTSEALAIERLYAADIRNDMAAWATREATQGRHIVAMARFSNVRGTIYNQDQDPLALERPAYVLTCDFEYGRYLNHRSASEIFHPIGGQGRLDFFRGAFEGTSDFGIVREFKSEPQGVELRLIAAHRMAPLGGPIARRCFALGRVNVLPAEVERRIRAEPGLADRGW
jgi:hypothetical protein